MAENQIISTLYIKNKKAIDELISRYKNGHEIYILIDKLLSKNIKRTDQEIYKIIKSEFRNLNFNDNLLKRGDTRAHEYYKIVSRFKNNIFTCLDIGIGDGSITQSLTKYIPKVFGIDIADERKFKSNYIFKKYDGITIPYKGFDLIVISMVLHHVEHLDKFLKSLYYSSNGIVLIREHDVTNKEEELIVTFQHDIMDNVYDSNTIYVGEQYKNFMSMDTIIKKMTDVGFKHLPYKYEFKNNIGKYCYIIFQK